MNIGHKYSLISERKETMKITINFNHNEHIAYRDLYDKSRICCSEEINSLQNNCREYGIDGQKIDDNTIAIIIPDRLAIAISKIMNKVLNFFGIMKPAAISLIEGLADEMNQLDNIDKNDQANGVE